MHQCFKAADFLGDVVLGAAGQIEDADTTAAVGGEKVAQAVKNP